MVSREIASSINWRRWEIFSKPSRWTCSCHAQHTHTQSLPCGEFKRTSNFNSLSAPIVNFHKHLFGDTLSRWTWAKNTVQINACSVHLHICTQLCMLCEFGAFHWLKRLSAPSRPYAKHSSASSQEIAVLRYHRMTVRLEVCVTVLNLVRIQNARRNVFPLLFSRVYRSRRAALLTEKDTER